MAVDQNEVKAAKDILWQDEVVEATVRQRMNPLLGGAVIMPTSVLATNKRLIILNRASMTLRVDYEVIPYRQIASVRLERGVVTSTIFVRVQGYDVDKGLLKNGKQEGEIDGLKNKEAQEFADCINRRLEQMQDMAEGEQPGAGQADKSMGAYVFCIKCGTKQVPGAQFCSKCGAKLVTS